MAITTTGDVGESAVILIFSQPEEAVKKSPILVQFLFMTLLETLRLTLRPLTLDDQESLFEITGDPDVMRHWTTGPDLTLVDVEKRLLRAQQHLAIHGFSDWAVIDKARGRFIGFCGLQHQSLSGRERVGIGYALHKAVWKQGYGTEAALHVMHHAFHALQLDEVIATVAEDNAPSLKILQKCGFVFDHQAIYDGMPRLIYRAVEKKEIS